jgi:hypothetical protein
MTKPAGKKKPDTNYDDLTQIKGIGEVTQQWLRDTFAVRTYHDLMRISPTDIEDRLKAEGKITARSKIDGWLVQARALAGSVEPPTGAKGPAKAQQETWKTFSTFVVMFEEQQVQGEIRFQTKAHHMEADNTQAWPGITQTELIEWMLAQLGSKAMQALMPEPQPVLQEPVQTEVSDKLQRYAAKAQVLAGEQVSPLARAARPVPTQPEAAETVPPSPSPYSGKLQQFIMKAHQLAGES